MWWYISLARTAKIPEIEITAAEGSILAVDDNRNKSIKRTKKKKKLEILYNKVFNVV